MKNILTIDFEDWFHATVMQKYVQRSEWGSCCSRLEESTKIILDLLGKHGVKATFFVLGWVAQQHPDLVLQIHDAGHEIALHGYDHRLTYSLTQEAFIKDIKESRKIIEGLIKTKILGYRAPSWSINQKDPWALHILEKLDFKYDSSISRSDIYNYVFDDRGNKTVNKPYDGHMLELIQSDINIFGKYFPCAGGFFLRLYPYWLTRLFIKRMNRMRQRAMVYFHPWEICPVREIKQMTYGDRFLQFYNVKTMPQKLSRILSDFEFSSIKQTYY